MKIKNIISNFDSIDKKTCGSFSFSLAVSLCVCILTTYAAEVQESTESVLSFVTIAKPYIVSLFATVITFCLTTLSQNFIQIISLKAKGNDPDFGWQFVNLGYSIIYTILYFIYLMKCGLWSSILIIVLTIIAVGISIISFAEAFSTEKSSLVGVKNG